MLKDRAILFGVAALTAVATAGWVRQPSAPQIPVNSFTAPATAPMLDPAYASAPFATPVSSTVVPVNSGIYRQAGAPIAGPYTAAPQQAPRTVARSSRPRYAEPELQERPAPRVVDRDEGVQHESETVTKKRSTTKSVAIIGGSAAAGAAIGGLAGGGKGAAIGALGGGAAGLIYDRMTKNR